MIVLGLTGSIGMGKSTAVNRVKLGTKVFGNPGALKILEQILHPLVDQSRDRFLKQSQRGRQSVVALDIPFLLEIGANKHCHATVVVSAPSFIQEARVLSRPSMTREKLAGIQQHQMSDLEKCRRATFVIPTGNGRRLTLQALARIVRLFPGAVCFRATGASSHA